MENRASALPLHGVKGRFHPHQFLQRQFRQYLFDFSNSAHARKMHTSTSLVNVQPLGLGVFPPFVTKVGFGDALADSTPTCLSIG